LEIEIDLSLSADDNPFIMKSYRDYLYNKCNITGVSILKCYIYSITDFIVTCCGISYELYLFSLIKCLIKKQRCYNTQYVSRCLILFELRSLTNDENDEEKSGYKRNTSTSIFTRKFKRVEVKSKSQTTEHKEKVE